MNIRTFLKSTCRYQTAFVGIQTYLSRFWTQNNKVLKNNLLLFELLHAQLQRELGKEFCIHIILFEYARRALLQLVARLSGFYKEDAMMVLQVKQSGDLGILTLDGELTVERRMN